MFETTWRCVNVYELKFTIAPCNCRKHVTVSVYIDNKFTASFTAPACICLPLSASAYLPASLPFGICLSHCLLVTEQTELSRWGGRGGSDRGRGERGGSDGQIIKGGREGAGIEADRKADRVPNINAAESRQWSG